MNREYADNIVNPVKVAGDSIDEYDKNTVLRSGWFPETNYAVLEELRERHEELIEQRNRNQAEAVALGEKFYREDKARQAALDDAYLNGTPEKAKLPELTSPEERRAQLAEADSHVVAATRAVLAFAEEAIETLRGPVPEGWEPYIAATAKQAPPNGEAAKVLAEIAGQEAELRAQIQEAERVIATAGEAIRGFVPLRHWIAQNGNGERGQIQPGADLDVPPAYTAGTKPRDLGVPGWWKNEEMPADHAQEQPLAEPVDDDAESGVIDTSDPFHDELEKNR